ncbi:MAG: prepilin peptidase [Bacilli bacterium]|nr:prepilin peptidase [Bacilli bacterium]
MEQFYKIYFTIAFLLIGLIFGSFYNVVGLRVSKKENLLFPGSHCPKCNHKLKPYELIPVFSFIFLKGRCKKCKERISIMYPFIELCTGILFAVSFYKYGFSTDLILALLLSSLLMIIVVTDLNFYIIPDSIIVAFGILIFIYNIIDKGILDACTYVVYGLLMFGLMYALMKFGNALFKKESLGGGDIKLMGILGMINKPIVSITALSLAAFIALPCSIYFLKKNKDKVIPFGPFIVIGFILIMFLGIDTNDIIKFLTRA